MNKFLVLSLIFVASATVNVNAAENTKKEVVDLKDSNSVNVDSLGVKPTSLNGEITSENIVVPTAAVTEKTVAANNEQTVAAIATQAKVEENKVASATATVASDKKTANNNAKESEIPVLQEVNKKSASNDSSIFRILMSLGILGVVLTGAYVFVKKYAKNAGGKNNNKQIKILTQHYLGPRKSLAIVRVAGESILIGITEHNISMLKSLALLDEDIPEETIPVPASFAKIFGQKNTQVAKETSVPKSAYSAQALASQNQDEDDDFAIGGIKDIKDIVTSKLKGMRSIQ